MSTTKKFLLGFVALLLLIHVSLWVTEKTYLYKGVANTYLKGRSGPTIDEHMIFQNRVIKTSNPQDWPNSVDYNKEEVNDSLIEKMEFYKTVAFLVIKDDSVLYEQYWENFSDSSLSNSFSMAKTIVSVLVGAAIHEGKIKSVDQPVGDFIPEFKEGDKAKLTVKHLLTMSSGINFDEDYVNPFTYPAEAYYGSDLRKLTINGKYKLTEEPGKVFKYLSGNTQLLAFVLEAATGMKISDYASEKLWKPMGANHDAQWNLDDNGNEKAFCCFMSNARDFARYAKLYRDNGKWNGIQLVDSEYVANSIIPADLVQKDGSKLETYGYSWWLVNDYKGHNIFYMRGILGQYVWCIPDLNLIVVRLGRKRVPQPSDAHPEDMFIYLDAAMELTAKKNVVSEL